MTQLHTEYDCLAAGSRLLLVMYDAGDCDTIPWPPEKATYWTPEEWRWKLRSALFDAREMGDVPLMCKTVTLPNGDPFDIDGPMCSADEEREFLDYQAEADREQREWERDHL